MASLTRCDLEKDGDEDLSPWDEASINVWPHTGDEDTCSRENETITDKTDLGLVVEKATTRPSILSKTITGRSTASWPDPGPPPDGGRNAWRQAALLYLTTFNIFGYTTAFGSFQTYYESTLGVSPSTISWVGSVQLWLLFFIGTFSGRAVNAGCFRQVYITGCVMQLIGIFTTSVATQYWQLFLAQGLCMGIAILQFTPTMGLASTYYVERRALVMGIGALGSCTGACCSQSSSSDSSLASVSAGLFASEASLCSPSTSSRRTSTVLGSLPDGLDQLWNGLLSEKRLTCCTAPQLSSSCGACTSLSSTWEAMGVIVWA